MKKEEEFLGNLIKLGITGIVSAIGIGVGYFVAPQHSDVARYIPGIDARYKLDSRCQSVNAAGISIKFINSKTTSETRWVDCKTKEEYHLLQEFNNWGIFEASYEFIPQKTGNIYQGGWGSRLGVGDQKLSVPQDCIKILNVGKSDLKKFIVCESPEGKPYMREFSDWGVFEATYVFDKDAKKEIYQGGWFSRLGGNAQTLQLSKECTKVNTTSRSGDKKLVDCILENGNHMLQEYTDFGVFEARYVFEKNAKKSFYQGGLGSRLNGDLKVLKLPEECINVINVGKQGVKTVTCTTKNPKEIIMQEYTDFGVFQATHRFNLNTN